MARIYANENFPLPVVEELRRLGHDVLTTYESGRAGQRIPDEEVLPFAIGENRAVLTHNRRHFVRLHGTMPQHCGIIVCTADSDFVALAKRIHAEIGQRPTLNGLLLRVARPPS
jgi:hypothetical protein